MAKKAPGAFLIVFTTGVLSFILIFNIAIKVPPSITHVDGKVYVLMPREQMVIALFVSLTFWLISLYFFIRK